MKTRRHAKILELISEKAIDTQEELLRCLKQMGFDVTQATVSRDIKELRLVDTQLHLMTRLPICPSSFTLSLPNRSTG